MPLTQRTVTRVLVDANLVGRARRRLSRGSKQGLELIHAQGVAVKDVGRETFVLDQTREFDRSKDEGSRAAQLVLGNLGIGALFQHKEWIQIEDDRAVRGEVGFIPKLFDIAPESSRVNAFLFVVEQGLLERWTILFKELFTNLFGFFLLLLREQGLDDRRKFPERLVQCWNREPRQLGLGRVRDRRSRADTTQRRVLRLGASTLLKRAHGGRQWNRFASSDGCHEDAIIVLPLPRSSVTTGQRFSVRVCDRRQFDFVIANSVANSKTECPKNVRRALAPITVDLVSSGAALHRWTHAISVVLRFDMVT